MQLVDWAIYISQLLNPFAGISVAVPLGLGVLKLPFWGVALLAVPVNLLQAAVVHAAWQAILKRPRARAWIESKRSPRVAGWFEARGAFAASALAAFLIGMIPAYVSMRFLGAPSGRLFGGLALGTAAFGGMITAACHAVGVGE